MPAECMVILGDRRDILVTGLEGDKIPEDRLEEAGSVYSTTTALGALSVPPVDKADRLQSVRKP